MTLHTMNFDWSWELNAPAEKLWPLVSDTNRFNRDTGLPTVTDWREPGEELANARRKLRIRVNGLPVAWEELPFEWVRPWRFGVVRRYPKGPLAEMRVRAELHTLGPDRTRLDYKVSAKVRGMFGKLAAHLQIGLLSRRQFERVFREYAEHVRDTGSPSPPPIPDEDAQARLAGVGPMLADRQTDEASAFRLADFLATADDLSLVRIRPALLARLWNLPRTDVLETCLEAVRAGVLDLRWDLLCPLCGGAKEQEKTLSELRSSREVHCDTCLIDFSVEFDRSVELTFVPNPSYREAADEMFCVAGPQVTPHILVQQLLEPGETREVAPLLDEGGYRIRPLDGAGGANFEIAGAAVDDEVTVRLGPNGVSTHGPALLGTAPRITLVNDTPVEQLMVLERTLWTDDVITAAEVTRNRRFRDLFSSEVLAHGEFISVGTLSILFTDLRDSTRLYREIGDAAAYGRVMEHFSVLEEAIRECDGTLVKTIGDAVMAAFPSPGAAMQAVETARRKLEARDPDAPKLTLKAGLHTGPSIAVTLNDQLDYFGTTVNIAARLGALSSGEDTVVTEVVRKDPSVRRLLERWKANVTPLDTPLKGIEDRLRLWRVRTP